MKSLIGLVAIACTLWRGRIVDAHDVVTGRITADNAVEVYADGHLCAQGEWAGGSLLTHAKSFTLPGSSAVIGLKGIDYGGLAGVIASFSDGIVTDATWKCSHHWSEGWSEPGFNDVNWAPATAYVRPDGQRPEEVAVSAQWIWTSDIRPTHYRQVYCRKVRRQSSLTVWMAADNAVEMYVDGEMIAEAIWPAGSLLNRAEDRIIPENYRVLGFKGIDFGGLGGIIASFSDGTVTDSTWKCSNTFQRGWSTLGFDDDHWEQATAYARPDGQRPAEVASGAQWIWTNTYSASHYTVAYCRKVRY